MSKIPTLEELLKAGVHFGHNKSKWHPKMGPSIFTEKNKVHIINLEKTQEQLEKALSFVEDVAAKGGTILFLGTKKQAQKIVKDAAISCNMPYITERWLGGTFTNARSILNLVKNYKKMKEERESGKLGRYTKKEQLIFTRKLDKQEPLIGGIENMTKIPDAIFIVDVKHDKTSLVEAQKVNVPVVALCDTNINPTKIDYPIAANDDAVKSIELITNLVAQAVKDGQAKAKQQQEKKAE